MNLQDWWIATVLSTTLTALLSNSSLAQRRGAKTARSFKVGDEIEYLWVGTWYPGSVLEVRGDSVGIEYEWGGSPRREFVPSLKLRFAWEAKAITPMRFWSDQSGEFRVRAAAIGLSDNSLTLHKEDGSEVTVPIDMLSDADQKLLRRAKASAGPSVAELISITTFETAGEGWSSPWNEAANLSDVPPDAPPSFANMPEKGVGFPKLHFHDDLVRVIPIGGRDGWMLAGTVTRLGEQPSRLLWVALASGKVKKIQYLPSGERLAACDPTSRQVLTIHPDVEDVPVLTVFRCDPSTDQAQAIKRWGSLSEQQWGSWDNWAEFVSPTRVIHEWGSKQYVVWDFESESEVYRIDQESFFGARPTISPGRKYLAIPEDSRVRVIESATGRTLASLPIQGDRAVGVGFSARGDRLAVLTPSESAIWTLGSGDQPQRLKADMIGSVFRSTIEWIDDRLLLIDRSILYDTELQLPVWNYETETFEVKRDSYGERTQTVLDGKLCYAVEFRGKASGFIVGAVELPGPGVREAVQGLDRETMYAIRRGSPVRLEIDCGAHDSEVRAALTNQIAANGWILDSGASTLIRAKMGRSNPQTVEYRKIMGGGSTFSVTVTPYFSTVQILFGEKVAWSGGSSTGLSPVLWLKDGQSPQDQANRAQQPNPDFFRQVQIPEKILDPNKKRGLGTSLISSRGLTPK